MSFHHSKYATYLRSPVVLIHSPNSWT